MIKTFIKCSKLQQNLHNTLIMPSLILKILAQHSNNAFSDFEDPLSLITVYLDSFFKKKKRVISVTYSKSSPKLFKLFVYKQHNQSNMKFKLENQFPWKIFQAIWSCPSESDGCNDFFFMTSLT